MTRRCEFGLALVLTATLAACASPGPRPTRPQTRAVAPPAVSGRDAASQDADARFKAALALMKARQYEPARAAFQALSTEFPEFSGPLTNLGILYVQEKQRDAALASLSRAVEANPRNAVALNWLGILYRESGNLAGAEDAYRRALAARPDYAPATLNLAILYDVFLRRRDEALERYRDYQRLTGGEDLIVSAWIRDLESPSPPAGVVTAAVAR